MTRAKTPTGKAGIPPQSLQDHDLEPVRGGFAPLVAAEPAKRKPARSAGFFIPEVDDEVVV